MSESSIDVDSLGGTDHQVAPLGQGIDHVLDHALFGFRIKIDQDVLEKDTVKRIFLEWKQQVVLLPGDQCLDLGFYRPPFGCRLFIKDTLVRWAGSIKRTARAS